MTRNYTTTKGHAHAVYDGSSWSVLAHPTNDLSAADEACPLGGHSYARGVTVDAWRDEAGFAHRDWRAEGLAASDLFSTRTGASDQFASLTDVAEAAIALAFDRIVNEAVRAASIAAGQAAALAERRGVTVVEVANGGPLADAPWTALAGPAGDGKAEAGVQRMDDPLDPDDTGPEQWSVWGWNPETRETFLDSTHDTEAEAVAAATERVDPSPEQRLTEALSAPGALDSLAQAAQRAASECADADHAWHAVTCAKPEQAHDRGVVDTLEELLRNDILDTDGALSVLEAVATDLAGDIAADFAIDAQATIAHVGIDQPDDAAAIAEDPEWSLQYAERGIHRDTLACALVGTKADVKRMSFDLALQGVEHRVARDADDPKRWHLAVRGGLAGTPRVWLTSIRGTEPEDVLQCHEPADGGQHPLIDPEVA